MNRIAIVLLLLMTPNLWSQNNETPSEKDRDSLRFRNTYSQVVLEESNWRISLPLWVPGFRGSFAFGNITIDPGFENPPPGGVPPENPPDEDDKLRQSKISIQFYLLANLSYRYKRFFIEADGMKATLDNDITFTDGDRLSFGGTIDGLIIRGFAGYRFLERSYPERLLKWSLEGYAGVRYFDLHVFANRLELLDVRQDWTDPIVGIRLPLVYKRWLFSLQGDYGGLPSSNHDSFFAGLNASYRFSKLFGLGLGWAYLNASYEGQNQDKFLQLGMELTGPVARLNFTF